MINAGGLMAKRKRGRQCKLNPELQKRFCHAVRLGMRYQDACRYVKISPGTFQSWTNRGAMGEQPFADFTSAVKEAETEGMLSCLESIERAHKNRDWKAAAWLLERRHSWWPNHMITTVTEEQSSMDLSTEEGRAEVIEALRALPAELLAEAIVGTGAEA